MNMANASIKIFLQWRRDIKGNGTVLCLPTTAGLWQGMSLPWNTSDRRGEKKERKKERKKKKKERKKEKLNNELT